MKNRMMFSRWRSHQNRRSLEARRSEVILGDQIRAEEGQVGLSEAWRAREAANRSQFFNAFVAVPNRKPEAAESTFLEDWIFFQDRSWELDARARSTLNDRMPLFRAKPAMRIAIGGIVSQPGAISCGMRLGLERVLSIRTYLLAHGIDPDRVGLAIRGTEWYLVEHSDESDDLNSPYSEYRLQVTDPHWVLARN